MQLESTEIILYIEDQGESTRFYEALFNCSASLNVPGMTEFTLSPLCKLGLMPNAGIARILSGKTPHPGKGTGIPRCELYLHVTDAKAIFEHANKMGAKLISPLAARDWGDNVCYFADPDGHVIAFAERTTSTD